MKNLKYSGPENGQAAPRSQYVSAEELIAKMKIAFTNAKDPEILPELETVGITEAMLSDYLVEIDHLEQLSQIQKREYGEQYAETDRFNLKKGEIDALFTRHRNLAKIAFKGDRQANATLGMDVGHKQAFAACFLLCADPGQPRFQNQSRRGGY